MKIFSFIIKSLVNVLFTPADPNLFGSRKRRKKKEKLSRQMRGYADETQAEIDALKTQNPFESAAAKSAMAESARRSKQMGQRFANVMGAGASPEAIIAAQGQTQEAIAGTAGNIAVGAEAQKAAEIANLRNLKQAQRGQAFAMKQSAIDETGSGWTGFFDSLSAVGEFASGVGQAASGLGI